jgi:hypothetical protein
MSDDEEEYEVERVLDKRTVKTGNKVRRRIAVVGTGDMVRRRAHCCVVGWATHLQLKAQYLLKWKGYPDSEATWSVPHVDSSVQATHVLVLVLTGAASS